jgi:hypothetical protein
MCGSFFANTPMDHAIRIEKSRSEAMKGNGEHFTLTKSQLDLQLKKTTAARHPQAQTATYFFFAYGLCDHGV